MEIKLFKKKKEVYCVLDGEQTSMMFLALALEMASKEEIVERFNNESPFFVAEDQSDKELVKMAETLSKQVAEFF